MGTDIKKESAMKIVGKICVSIVLCAMLAMGLFAFTACGYCSGSGSIGGASGNPDEVIYEHLHRYVHDMRTDEYVCKICGYVYEGDPDNLVEM